MSTPPKAPDSPTKPPSPIKIASPVKPPASPLKSHAKVTIIGGGPVGCAAAMAMHKRGYEVDIYEARGDLRAPGSADALRSINLAISARGLATLESIDPQIADRIRSKFVPMKGRMVHSVQGKQTSVDYGVYGESIQSISRLELIKELLNEVEKLGIRIHFGHKLLELAMDHRPEAVFESEGKTRPQITHVRSDTILGCDGAWSKVRTELARVTDFDYSQKYIDHYYVEMVIPAVEKQYAFDPNHLHIWPRGNFMFIGLANQDKSFTGTLFAPKQLLEDLDSFDKFHEFFKTNFADALEIIGADRLAKYYKNPRGKLMNVKCTPYHYDNKLLILGDSAHSMVPFYGQGLNCGLEDVRVLMSLMAKLPPRRAFAEYTAVRHPDLLAISDLSMRNYREMSQGVATRTFAVRKFLDGLLNRVLGDRWLPLYTMVSFRADVPYSEAVRRDARQTRILTRLIFVLETSLALALAFSVYHWRHGLSSCGAAVVEHLKHINWKGLWSSTREVGMASAAHVAGAVGYSFGFIRGLF